jgi:hypothetical protein
MRTICCVVLHFRDCLMAPEFDLLYLEVSRLSSNHSQGQSHTESENIKLGFGNLRKARPHFSMGITFGIATVLISEMVAIYLLVKIWRSK